MTKKNLKKITEISSVKTDGTIISDNIYPLTTSPLPLPPSEDLPPQTDRVNNITQKEASAYKAGMTRAKLLKSIVEGLQAVKIDTNVVDKDGNYVEQPDTSARLRAAELGLKYFGDMKEMQATVDNSRHTHVTVMWKTPNRIVDVD